MRKVKSALGFAMAICIGLLTTSLSAQVQSYELDHVHSGASFVVRHAVTPMTGYFTDFDVDIEWNEADPTQSVITAELDPASVVMGNNDLTQTLKGEDFFDTKNHGKWTFFSKKIEEDDGKYVVIGDMTIRGITKQVIVPFEFLGTYETSKMNKAGFLGEFSIDRTSYGVKYDPEGKLVDKVVRIRLALEMNAVTN